MAYEYGIITNIQHFSVDDGPGIRTTVFFKGCSLKCRWCHNPETISPKLQLQYDSHKCIGCEGCKAACENAVHLFENGAHMVQWERCAQSFACAALCPSGALTVLGKCMDVPALMSELVKDSAFYSKSGGGVTLSGGEPLLQADFCARLLQELQSRGIHTAVDTAGNVPWEAFEKTAPYTNLYLFDVKAASKELHRQATGTDNIRIQQNLSVIASLQTPVWVRVPLIPGINDSEEELKAIAQIIRSADCVEKIQVLPYHAMGLSKYQAIGQAREPHSFTVPSPEKMEAVRKLFVSQGLPQTEL